MVFTFLFLFNIFQQFHHLLIFITFSIKVWHFPILKNSIKWYTKICKPHIALLLNGNIFLLSCLFRTIKRCSIKINITFLGLLCLSKIFIYIYKKKTRDKLCRIWKTAKRNNMFISYTIFRIFPSFAVQQNFSDPKLLPYNSHV